MLLKQRFMTIYFRLYPRAYQQLSDNWNLGEKKRLWSRQGDRRAALLP